MAELTEAVGAALTARYPVARAGRPPKSGADSPRGLRARANRILEAFGGNRKQAAAAAGIPYSTFGHALKGRNQSAKTRNKMISAFEEFVTSPARARAVKRVGLPDLWSIGAVVVVEPGGSRYINGRPPGAPPEDIWHINTAPEWRYFNAEGLDSARIVGAWLTHGAAAAAGALVDEVAAVYGDEIGFEGEHVDVAFHHRL